MSRAAFALFAPVVLALCAAISACQLVAGYKSFGAHPCNVLPASKLDDHGNATLVLSKQPNGTCFWIDRTEVTVQQYANFVDSGAPSGPACQWKTALSDPADSLGKDAPYGNASDACAAALVGESDPFRPSKPIRCVDWCDAFAFCAWEGAGMHLCGGNPNGGFFGANGRREDEWGESCSANGASYPTGNKTASGQCNVGLSPALCLSELKEPCGPEDVTNPTDCVSPCGALHMVGNVAEWVDLCGAPGAGDDGGTNCQTRGGSFAGQINDADETCYNLPGSAPMSQPDPTIGFRCCADLTADEIQMVGQ